MACTAIRDAVRSIKADRDGHEPFQLCAINSPGEGKHPAECSDRNSNKATGNNLPRFLHARAAACGKVRVGAFSEVDLRNAKSACPQDLTRSARSLTAGLCQTWKSRHLVGGILVRNTTCGPIKCPRREARWIRTIQSTRRSDARPHDRWHLPRLPNTGLLTFHRLDHQSSEVPERCIKFNLMVSAHCEPISASGIRRFSPSRYLADVSPQRFMRTWWA